MTLNSKIYNPAFSEILEHVNREATILGINFYLAGAVARDYHLSKSGEYIPSRRTEDIDIAVMVANEEQFIQLKKRLVETKLFKEHTEPIKLIFKEALELDLLPFGDIEESGVTKLTKPKIFTLEMPGFTLLNEYTEEAKWNERLKAKVCSLEGLVLLKLFANHDRPQRTKDLIDIQLIIKLYFNLFSEEVYEIHFDLMNLYDTHDVAYISKICAHVIGRKLKMILQKDELLLKRTIEILKLNKDGFWDNMLIGLIE